MTLDRAVRKPGELQASVAGLPAAKFTSKKCLKLPRRTKASCSIAAAAADLLGLLWMGSDAEAGNCEESACCSAFAGELLLLCSVLQVYIAYGSESLCHSFNNDIECRARSRQ